MFSPPSPEASYISRRSPVLGRRGMAASSQPLATEAGLLVLRKGGTAADAAVAMAAALNVCEPCSTGIGGDAFVLWYDASTQQVESIQGNGRSPGALTLDLVAARGHTAVLPAFDALTVTVPGAAAALVDTVERYGKLPLASVLQPAIELADGGWPVGPFTAAAWHKGRHQLLQGGPHGVHLLKEASRGPRAGELMHNPHLANTFRDLASFGKAGFYSGRVASAVTSAVQAKGGVLEAGDLAAHRSSFELPISVEYRGMVRVWEVPPPTQGLAALAALNTLEAYYKDACVQLPEGEAPGLELKEKGRGQGLPQWGSAVHQHVMIEAMRLGFADSLSFVCDPEHAPVPLATLLSKRRAAEQAARIRSGGGKVGLVEEVRLELLAGVDRMASTLDPRSAAAAAGAALRDEELRLGSDTVYLCAVDQWGNGCSMINSNFMGFGTGIVPEGCGFSLQNRGFGFSLSPAHPNCLAPRKRPYHTIIPGLSTFCNPKKEGEDSNPKENADDLVPEAAVGGALHSVFGVMGGFMQPQGHLQLLSNVVDYHLDPQYALDLPRFCILGLPCKVKGHGAHPVRESHVAIECGQGREALAEELRGMGHRVEVYSGEERETFGKGQMIVRDPVSGVLWGGSEGRSDGCAMGF